MALNTLCVAIVHHNQPPWLSSFLCESWRKQLWYLSLCVKTYPYCCFNRLCRVLVPRSVPDWDVSEDVQFGATPLLPFFFQLLWLQCQYFRSSTDVLFLPNYYYTVCGLVIKRPFFTSPSLCRSLLAASLKCCGVSSGPELPLASASCVLSVCWGSSRLPSQRCCLPLFSFVNISYYLQWCYVCTTYIHVRLAHIQEWNDL